MRYNMAAIPICIEFAVAHSLRECDIHIVRTAAANRTRQVGRPSITPHTVEP